MLICCRYYLHKLLPIFTGVSPTTIYWRRSRMFLVFRVCIPFGALCLHHTIQCNQIIVADVFLFSTIKNFIYFSTFFINYNGHFCPHTHTHTLSVQSPSLLLWIKILISWLLLLFSKNCCHSTYFTSCIMNVSTF